MHLALFVVNPRSWDPAVLLRREDTPVMVWSDSKSECKMLTL